MVWETSQSIGDLGLGYRAIGGPLEMCRMLKEQARGRMHCPESARIPSWGKGGSGRPEAKSSAVLGAYLWEKLFGDCL